jgi:hypothetical protein
MIGVFSGEVDRLRVSIGKPLAGRSLVFGRVQAAALL